MKTIRGFAVQLRTVAATERTRSLLEFSHVVSVNRSVDCKIERRLRR
jgi:hypothetical protein